MSGSIPTGGANTLGVYMDSNPLVDRYDAAAKMIRECKVNDSDSERVFGKAYQRLVKAGLAQQIKKKYRIGV